MKQFIALMKIILKSVCLDIAIILNLITEAIIQIER